MASHQKIILYSCLVNKRDRIKPIEFDDGFKYVLFTDDLKADAKGWEIRPVVWTSEDPVLTARYHKHHPFVLFPDATYTIWLDMTHWAYQSLIPLLTNFDLMLHKHQERHTICAEADICKFLKFDSPEIIESQITHYKNDGFIDNIGLYSTSCLIRKNTYQCQMLSEMWWEEICKWSKRDQISLPYCLWRLGLTPGVIPGMDRGGFSQYFEMISHHKNYKTNNQCKLKII